MHPPRALHRLLLALLFASAAIAGAKTRTAADAEVQLKRTQERIKAVTAQVHGEVAQRDRAAGALAHAESALESARNDLSDVRGRLEASEARHGQLLAEQALARASLGRERGALTEQTRAAYVTGREESLKLLLNASDPARLGRLLVDYGYLSRARALRIAAIRDEVEHLETVEAEVALEANRLRGLASDETERVNALARARSARERALEVVKADIDTKSTELKRLKSNAASLEDLVARLREALAQNESEEGERGHGPFAQARGRLPWPARGKIVAHYGDDRPGGLKWQGLLLETTPGEKVRAPFAGRVVYADWLPGLGLLLILDHGDGYLTLYGHNERLFRSVGQQVTPGELLASSGEGSPQPDPELYFEIRHGTKPLDPGGWLKGQASR